MQTFNPVSVALFEAYSIYYHTKGGKLRAHLDCFRISERNGETLAFYKVKFRDPSTGLKYSRTYLWAIRNGTPKEIKQFDYKITR